MSRYLGIALALAVGCGAADPSPTTQSPDAPALPTEPFPPGAVDAPRDGRGASTDAPSNDAVDADAGGSDEIAACFASCPKASTAECKATCEEVCLSGRCISDPEKPFAWSHVDTVTCSAKAVVFDKAEGGLRACIIK